MNYQLRWLEEGDLQNALDLVWRVFFEFEAPSYSHDGVAEFRKFIEIDSIKEKFKNNELIFFGAFDEEKIVGVIAVSKSLHISLLFVEKNYHRQGIAKNLFTLMLDSSDISGKEYVTVNSSPYAYEVYKRLGFEPIGFEQVKNGIIFTPMQYKIDD